MLLKSGYTIALISSAVIISLYIVAMFYAFPIHLERLIPLTFVRILFYSMLFLLLLKEILSSRHKGKRYIVVVLVLISAEYSLIAALREVSQLVPGYFVVIPPSFIYSRCDVTINCNDFATLSISVPLTIASILFIYSLHGMFVTSATRSSE